jgi:hypothetical protein
VCKTQEPESFSIHLLIASKRIFFLRDTKITPYCLYFEFDFISIKIYFINVLRIVSIKFIIIKRLSFKFF